MSETNFLLGTKFKRAQKIGVTAHECPPPHVAEHEPLLLLLSVWQNALLVNPDVWKCGQRKQSPN